LVTLLLVGSLFTLAGAGCWFSRLSDELGVILLALGVFSLEKGWAGWRYGAFLCPGGVVLRRGRTVEDVPWGWVSVVEEVPEKRMYWLVSSAGARWELDLAFSPDLPAFIDALYQESQRRSISWVVFAGTGADGPTFRRG